MSKEYKYHWIICLVLLLGTSCSSSILEQESSSEHLSMHLGVVKSSSDSQELNREQIQNLRVFLVDRNEQIIANTFFESLDQNYGNHFHLTLPNIPRGQYNLYILANEHSLALNNLDNLQDESDLKNITVPHHIASNSDIPHVGVVRNILLNEDHQKITISLERIIAKMEFNFKNYGDKPITINSLQLHNLQINSESLFANTSNYLQGGENYILDQLNLFIKPNELRTHTVYIRESKTADKPLSLSLKSADGVFFEPIELVTTEGLPMYKIDRNSIIRFHIAIVQSKIHALYFEVVPWTKENIDIPIFS